MSKGSFFDKSKYVFYHFLIFSLLQKLFRGFHTFGEPCVRARARARVCVCVCVCVYRVFDNSVNNFYEQLGRTKLRLKVL